MIVQKVEVYTGMHQLLIPVTSEFYWYGKFLQMGLGEDEWSRWTLVASTNACVRDTEGDELYIERQKVIGGWKQRSEDAILLAWVIVKGPWAQELKEAKNGEMHKGICIYPQFDFSSGKRLPDFWPPGPHHFKPPTLWPFVSTALGT